MSCGAAPAASASLERRRDAPDEVADRAERPRDREVVAGAEQHPRAGVEILEEPGDERGLADPGLAGDEHDAALAARGRVARLGERRQCPVALEQLHGSTIDPSRVEAYVCAAARSRASISIFFIFSIAAMTRCDFSDPDRRAARSGRSERSARTGRTCPSASRTGLPRRPRRARSRSGRPLPGSRS